MQRRGSHEVIVADGTVELAKRRAILLKRAQA
jgi:hypothetical protein